MRIDWISILLLISYGKAVHTSAMTVGIFGLGRFGSFWGNLLARNFEVVGYDIDAERIFPESVRRVDLQGLCAYRTIFLCVTIRALPDALRSIAPLLEDGTLVADTCSVKVLPARWMREILPSGTLILATHPMFGPESAKAGLDGLALMMDPLRMEAEDFRFWEDEFRSWGLSTVRMDCDRHDREAAYSQALTHFVGRSLHRMGLPETEIATRWYRSLHAIARQCVRDAPELFEDMQRFNPYAAGMRGALLAAFGSTLAELGEDISALVGPTDARVGERSALDEGARSPVHSEEGAGR